MMITLVPILVMVAGLLMWALANNPKVAEAGRILFFCGALVLTFALAKHVVRIG